MDTEQSACIVQIFDEKAVKENEERKKRNREYQRAWRQRKKALKGNLSKEEEERKKKEKEEKRKQRLRDNQRAYYYREKLKSAEEKLDGLQIKKEKLEINEDEDLEQNQFFTKQLHIYEESHKCITPEVILHRIKDIPGDGNCLFHSLIYALRLQISTCDLRRQLRDSSYLNSCHNPQEAYNILSSNNEYGDSDCLYLFAKTYNQNICVHYQYLNVNSRNEDTRFCHLKANDTNNWIHLDLREQHFTPYLTDDEKWEEVERKRKQKNIEYAKRYRTRKRISSLQTISSARDVARDVLDVKGAPYLPPVCSSKTVLNTSLSRDNCISIEDKKHQRHFPSQVVESSQSFIHHQTYSAFQQNASGHLQFEKECVENEFGHSCDICDRLWFKKDLVYLENNDSTANIEFIRQLLSDIAITEIKICMSCFIPIEKQRIPQLSVYNGFKYPPLPDRLKDFPLDLITERYISPRLPFMQIRRLRHVHGRNGIHGQVINVPIEVKTMVSQLPRQVNNDHAVTVHIKRKKILKSSNVYGIVMKRKIKEWLRYLKDTPLYKSCDVTVDDDFLNDRSYDVKNEILFDEDGDNDISEQIPVEESLVAQEQTLMWNNDIYSKAAPDEGNSSKSLRSDERAEELCFPQIYLGQLRQFRFAATPFMMVTSELRRSDRRGVTPQHLLYMAMKIMRFRIKEHRNITKKNVGKSSAITKERIQSHDYIYGCVESKLPLLRSIPNSVYYWAERKRDLFAMIRHYGKPTVSFTISANEIGWPKLLQLLHNLKNNVKITLEDAANLHFIEKSNLINGDSVTCVLYFNHLVENLLKILQSKRYSPFRKYRVLHYFKRIEFNSSQHRGTQHAHILAWLDNAPVDPLNRDYNEAINLIDFLISVSAGEASGDIHLQTHKHTYNCYKSIASSRQQKCRFDAPFLPVKKTMILSPMPDTENGFQHYKSKYNKIKKNLEKYEYNDFQSFYYENDIASDNEYVKIIRAGINRPRVLPKREPCEKWNNPFNPFILNVFRSSTDFQFITEEHSCAAYVVEYVDKTNRGVSDLKRQIIDIIDERPEFSLFDITKNISNNILNHTEMTSQEAAWYLLRETMSKSSMSSSRIAYIPTIRPADRQMNTMKELSELEDDYAGVWKSNWFEKYEKRPESLAGISLAEFVSKYHNNSKDEILLRKVPIIIGYRNYDMCTEYNEYRREMVTLHLPFRHEESEILSESRYIQLYEDNEALILERRKAFESNFDIKKTLEICKELCREDVSDDGDEMNDVVDSKPSSMPSENPFAESYQNPNPDLQWHCNDTGVSWPMLEISVTKVGGVKWPVLEISGINVKPKGNVGTDNEVVPEELDHSCYSDDRYNDRGIKQEVLEISSIKVEPVDGEGASDNEVVPEEIVMKLDQPCCSNDHYHGRKNFAAIKREVPEEFNIKVEFANEGALDNKILQDDIVMEHGASYYRDGQNFVAIKQEVSDDSRIEVEFTDEGALDNEMLKEDKAMEHGASSHSDGQNFVAIKREVPEDSSIEDECANGALDNKILQNDMAMEHGASSYSDGQNFVAIKREVPEDSSIEDECANEGALDNKILQNDMAMEHGASSYSDGQNFVAIKREVPEDSSIEVEFAAEGGADNEILQEYMVMECDTFCYSDGQYNVSGTKKIKREADSDDEYLPNKTTKKVLQ